MTYVFSFQSSDLALKIFARGKYDAKSANCEEIRGKEYRIICSHVNKDANVSFCQKNVQFLRRFEIFVYFT